MIELSPERLRDLVVRDGIIDTGSFEALRVEANRQRQSVGDTLVARGILTKDYYLALVAKALGLQRVNLGTTPIDEQVLHLIEEDVARSRRAIVFGREADGRFRVAMEDPTDLEAIDFLGLRLGAPVEPFLASEEDLNHGFSLYERRLTQDFKTVIEKSVEASLRSQARGDLEKAAQDLPLVAIVDNLIAYAASSRASDVHFEVLDDAVTVRYRIDGILHEIIRMPKEIHPAVVARIKILSSLRVDEHRRPQDGRFRHKVGDAVIDIRVSIIPTYHGEKVELRLFASTEKPLSLVELGFLEDQEQLVRAAIAKSYGMVVVCGPTGSGKSTTLYALLNLLNRPEVNIVTIEDPIEYDIRYVNQIQVNVAAGIDFASGLRSILRQDPNIIMVGEIRDGETANISVQSALTGHLVLTSLHTNDAATAIPRLIDMQVPPFLVAAVVNDIVAQRLVRRIHLACIESYVPGPEIEAIIKGQLVELGVDPAKVGMPKVLYRGRGCPECGQTGFLGRLGIYEVLSFTEAMRKLVVAGDFSLASVQRLARSEGMVTLFEDGLRKVERGVTTIDEVLRVIRE